MNIDKLHITCVNLHVPGPAISAYFMFKRLILPIQTSDSKYVYTHYDVDSYPQ